MVTPEQVMREANDEFVNGIVSEMSSYYRESIRACAALRDAFGASGGRDEGPQAAAAMEAAKAVWRRWRTAEATAQLAAFDARRTDGQGSAPSLVVDDSAGLTYIRLPPFSTAAAAIAPNGVVSGGESDSEDGGLVLEANGDGGDSDSDGGLMLEENGDSGGDIDESDGLLLEENT